MSVRAKFYCAEKREHANHVNTEKMETVVLQPIMNGSEENKRFYKYSPSGKIELCIMNPEAAKQFEVGKSYYVDFTPAD
ncbi:MAG: hypothetical protein ACQEXQ_16440 [Bacillota bacterium]